MEPQHDPARYPIGPWQEKPAYPPELIRHLVTKIRELPDAYAATMAHCQPADLAKQYREGSWTVQQLVHHVADTHAMHLMRFKNALTEPGTTGLMADVNAWSALKEARTAPLSASLLILKGLHERIAHLAESLHPDELALSYYHPGRQRDLTLAQALDIVVWHAEHHLAHIRLALRRPA